MGKGKNKEYKVLMLGRGSGKNVLVHKLILLEKMKTQKLECTENERSEYLRKIYQLLINFLKKVETHRSIQLSEESAQLCRGLDPNSERLDFEPIKTLWSDPIIKSAHFQSKILRLPQCPGLYFEELHRMSSENYIPTDMDILSFPVHSTVSLEQKQQQQQKQKKMGTSKLASLRISTTKRTGVRAAFSNVEQSESAEDFRVGSNNTSNNSSINLPRVAQSPHAHRAVLRSESDSAIEIGSSANVGLVEIKEKIKEGKWLKILDVAMQRSDERKWLGMFSDVTALVYVVDVSEFETVLVNKREVNKMEDTLDEFERLCEEPFSTVRKIIFFVNVEQLGRKLNDDNIQIASHLTNYKGNNQVPEFLEYLQERFRVLEKTQVFFFKITETETTMTKMIIATIEEFEEQARINILL